LYIGIGLITTLIKKIKSLFGRKNKGAIPFAEKSREAARDIPFPGDETHHPPRLKKIRDDRPKKQPKQIQEKPQRPAAWNQEEYQVPEMEGKIRFHDLDLPNQILHAVFDLNYQYCTPVQAGILPYALTGKDALGKAQTGTGKSAAFLITIFSRMLRNPVKGGPPKGFPRALILAPTRELVLQIEKDALSLCKYTPFKVISVFGGTGYEKQMQNLKDRSYDVVVATPGRLIDFQRKNLIKLDKVEILVLDEADRMLDMGFIPDVRKIVYSTPHKSKRQTFFYSATFSPEVMRLAEQWTTDPCCVEIEPEQVAAETVKQVVYITTTKEKFPILYNLIVSNNLERVLVFTNRRDQARDLAKKLQNYGISNALISGEVQQNKRIRALEGFRAGKCRVLVATDVAARGIHIEDISHVINYNLPQDPESYVHRIGRTGRAGSSGISVSFACEEDSFHIPDIESFLGSELVCEYPDDVLIEEPPVPVRETEETTDDQSAKQEPLRPVRRPRKRPQSRTRSAKPETASNSHENGKTPEKNGDQAGEKADKPRRRRNRSRRQKPPHKEIQVTNHDEP
jgi:ATP-dependent RNA helicase RhlB